MENANRLDEFLCFYKEEEWHEEDYALVRAKHQKDATDKIVEHLRKVGVEKVYSVGAQPVSNIIKIGFE